VEIALVSVNRGIARLIGRRNGAPVVSAIAKSRIADPVVFVGSQGIAGDSQADRSVHGGIDKAVHAYSADHWPWWKAEKGFVCAAGCFGENLTVSGADEGDVAIGDRFQWGDVILQVAQPRGPCATLDIHNARSGVAHTMMLSGRCGWYLRVIREGWAPTLGTTCARISTNGGPSVREAFLARHDVRAPLPMRRRVQCAPALAESWRRAVEQLALANK
jgi:MOSC domain-containing protein YiiM